MNRRPHKAALRAREGAAARGLAQVKVLVEATEAELRGSARDMLTRMTSTWTLTASDVPAEPGDDTDAAALPTEWRYEAVYADAPHPGFTFGGLFLALPPADGVAEAMTRGADGVVGARRLGRRRRVHLSQRRRPRPHPAHGKAQGPTTGHPDALIRDSRRKSPWHGVAQSSI